MTADEIRAALARFSQFSLAAVLSLGLAAGTALAQDEDEDAEEPATRDYEEVVVTGSRIRRDTYTSVSPLQVITGQVSREIGLIDPGTILQESSAAQGQQIDLTFSGFRLDNGPASTTIDLRGLGAGRTLILVNGRRLSPAGVEGAPFAPDTNLIPGSLVQQYEVLLDGASSVYGSDAVAGVVNVILRKDFEGLELEAFASVPSAGDGDGYSNQISGTWGYNGDRGFIGVGFEYTEVDDMSFSDRKWTAECDKHREITTDGEIRTEDLFYTNFYNQRSPGECQIGSFAGFANEGGAARIGSLFATPGTSNMGIPGWSHWRSFGVPIDTTNSGVADVSFADYNWNGPDRYQELIPELERTGILAFGEYTFEGEANITPYFEVQYNRRESDFLGGPGNVGASAGANNPFNPCNPNQPNGVDCNEAWNSLLNDPNFLDDWLPVYGAPPSAFGLEIDTSAPGYDPSWPMLAVFTVRGDRDNVVTDLEQTRAVIGVRGDMPFLNRGSLRNWSFDTYVSYSESDGTSSRLGIRQDRLDLALGNYSFTSTPCVNDLGAAAELVDDALDGCVPVNVFAPSLYQNPVNNDFATQAERDYLFDSRDFRTKYEQLIAAAYITGEVFELPGGDAQLVLGVEYRDDEINSLPDEVAAEGLFASFFVDKGAVGSKSTEEFFAEIEMPLFANYTGMKELTANVSTRYTNDEFYGSAWTHSAKLAYRPIDSLLIRATVGTSFRAPNLRENFLEGQTGFLQLTDPCVVPLAAIDIDGNYDPGADNREAQVIANCLADPGVDPFSFTNGGNTFYFMEVNEGGATDVEDEKSDSMSAGFTWEQPFFEAFDLVFGATYYRIDIRNEIISPSAAFIIADCYGDLEGDSTFCSRIQRDPADSTISVIDQGFINRDQLRSHGVDLNMSVNWPTQIFGKAVDLQADFAFNRTLEVASKLIEGGSTNELDTFQGELAFPEWKGRAAFRADVGNWRYTWSTRYVSSVRQDIDGVDAFENVFAGAGDTCLGPENGDVNCRDIGFADNYFVHDASIYYFADNWTFGAGVRNVLNEAPAIVDPTESGTGTNALLGSGYDLLGRTAFFNASYNWQ